jgi:hypothetical protein
MDFPIRIPFKLGKVKNSNSWTDETTSKFYNLINTLNTNINNKSVEKNITPLNTSVTLTAEHNIGVIGSNLNPGSYNININVDIEENKKLYYLVIDSNKSNFTLTSTLAIYSNKNLSFNRTLYIIRKLDEETILVYKELKDIYVPDKPDYETLDFLDWDLPSG